MMTSAEIRQQFLDFFKSKAHQIVPSAPVVVKNDPTLLFTNAGMNQFKDYFLGNKQPEYKRIADTQKCLRVSGKHNDLEEVGVDTYHHTLFEMLGNWSFGDYFKAEAIAWSWELLTEVYKLDKSRLYVTIFEGDAKEGLPKDEEAYNEWKKCLSESGVPEADIANRILLGNKKDNFWEMGDTGPCGPCTEIHVDCRSDEERKAVDGASLVNNDHPQVIEIWNNVFMQFNRLKDGSLQPLPAQHVDTGMGFERLVRVIQGKQSNYDTDVFTGTIEVISSIVNKVYKAGDDKESIAFRVLADHIRAIAFTIADGQLPSNTGAGYVIRRILRRAVRYYFSYLDYKQPLLHQLMPVLAKQFEHVFPELHAQLDFVSKVVKEEEDAFLRTLDKGINRFIEYTTQNNKLRLPLIKDESDWKELTQEELERVQTIDGKFAFELYDTYGFPLDLTQLMASEDHLKVDEDGFNTEMQKQKDRSRAATAIDTEDWVTVNDITTNKFVGYDDFLIETKIAKYRKVKAKGNEFYQIVLAETPFYAESGGQVGDKGKLVIKNEELIIFDTKKENDLIIHLTAKLPADIDLSAPVIAKIDLENRLQTSCNHTATHLLHAALRQVLGKHVAQKGSLVNNEGLRFDVSHFAKITDEELREVEFLVNEKIRANIPVVIKTMSKDEATALGAMALFGEKYGDVVRVVIADPNYSVELCGGTHVFSTGNIGLIKITSEAAVAAGVRRLEALTGSAAFNYLYEQFSGIKEISALLKTKDPLKAVEKIITEKQELEKKLERLEAKQLAVLKNELAAQKQTVNGNHFIGAVLETDSADSLKKLANDLKNDAALVVLAASINGKASVAINVADDLVAKGIEAPKVIKEHITPIIKGGGGGSKNLATAGGQDASNLSTVITAVKKLI